MAWRVVIAGGGFGGFYAASSLVRSMPPHSVSVTLVTDTNFMLYTPLLPGAGGGSLEPRHVVVPLRDALPDTVDLRLGHVVGADPSRNVVTARSVEGMMEEIGYDHLVVSVGSVSRTLPIPGLAEHALGFKSLPDAIGLRDRLVRNLEIAETIDDLERRKEYLNYVFVGAGYAGLEGIAELQDFAADLLDRYPRCRVSGMRFVLVEATGRVMPEISEGLAEFAVRELRARGMEFRIETTLESLTQTAATLSDGEVVPTRTLVWTAGVKPHPVVAKLGLPLSDRGRIVTDEFLQVEGHVNVWAIGDAASVPDPAKKFEVPSPPTAQHAVRQGKTVGRNVAAAMGSGKPKRFDYKTLGVFVDMGRGKAVAETVGIRWRGRKAWLLARTYHLALMPGWGRRARLLTDWNIGLLFGRDHSELGLHAGRLVGDDDDV
jgi:NADH:ubiquinone reductase (H+-translocating)